MSTLVTASRESSQAMASWWAGYWGIMCTGDGVAWALVRASLKPCSLSNGMMSKPE